MNIQSKTPIVNVKDKLISIISYFSMGIIGLVFMVFAYFFKKKVNFFLMYNIIQSMLISIFLAILNIFIQIILQIIMVIPFISKLGITLNMFLQARIQFFGLYLNKIELIIFLLLVYITIGILMGKIFNIPFFTKLMKTVMRAYKF